KAAYDQAVSDGKKILEKANATQAEVDAAKQAIEDAKGKLDGAETQKEALTTATSTDAESTKANDAKYYNGSAE
ncbi:FIVAR domain-containing protein, partial [Streptococcus sp. 596553]|uniref:FIVAR domain-containing protein n=1 Tax=Streptococcus sp. 596553 TaxID=2250596 RepID=UPI00190F8585